MKVDFNELFRLWIESDKIIDENTRYQDLDFDKFCERCLKPILKSINIVYNSSVWISAFSGRRGIGGESKVVFIKHPVESEERKKQWEEIIKLWAECKEYGTYVSSFGSLFGDSLEWKDFPTILQLTPDNGKFLSVDALFEQGFLKLDFGNVVEMLKEYVEIEKRPGRSPIQVLEATYNRITADTKTIETFKAGIPARLQNVFATSPEKVLNYVCWLHIGYNISNYPYVFYVPAIRLTELPPYSPIKVSPYGLIMGLKIGIPSEIMWFLKEIIPKAYLILLETEFRRKIIEHAKNPLARVKLSDIPKDKLQDARSTLFLCPHTPKDIFKYNNWNDWKTHFQKQFQKQEIDVDGKKGTWEDVGDGELMAIFNTISSLGDDCSKFAAIKFASMLERKKDGEFSLLDFYEHLVWEYLDEPRIKITLNYYGKMFKLEDDEHFRKVAFQKEVWNEIPHREYTIAEMKGVPYTFYELKEAIVNKVEENIFKMNSQSTSVAVEFSEQDKKVKARIVIKDDIGKAYTNVYDQNSASSENRFLRFLKEKLKSSNLKVLCLGDALGNQAASGSLVESFKAEQENESYVVTIMNEYTEINIKLK
jgi:hypothetical protein